MPKYYFHYKDDGPRGYCPQTMSVTCHWSKLYVVECDYYQLKESINKLIHSSSRLRPRIDNVWCDDEEESFASGYEMIQKVKLEEDDK